MRELFKGVSLATFAAGNRRIIKAVKARTTTEPDPCAHPGHKNPGRAEPAEHPFVTWAKRVGGTAGVLFILWPMVGKWAPTVATGTITLWVLVALVAGQDQPADAAPNPAVDASSEADDDQDDEIQGPPPTATLYALIRHVAGLTKQGTAAHLSQVLEEAEKRGLLGGWEVEDLRAHLADLGVPVVEKKKLTVGGRDRTRMAVLLDALPAADPAPVPAVASGAA